MKKENQSPFLAVRRLFLLTTLVTAFMFSSSADRFISQVNAEASAVEAVSPKGMGGSVTATGDSERKTTLSPSQTKATSSTMRSALRASRVTQGVSKVHNLPPVVKLPGKEDENDLRVDLSEEPAEGKQV